MSQSREKERGVSVVEAAFALPVMFLFIFGLVDLGMWTFNSNQATNAARDGARAGILSYELADVEGSPDHDAIVAAVQAHLPEGTIESSDVTVECIGPVTCVDAIPELDRIKVHVEWEWSLITPVATVIGVSEGVSAGSATMALIGRPIDLTTPMDPDPDPDLDPEPPPGCAASTLTAAPATVDRKEFQLGGTMSIGFTTNGSEACQDLEIILQTEKDNPNSETISHECGCEVDPEDPTQWSWDYTGSNNVWKKGIVLVRLMSGSTELDNTTFEVTN